MIRHFFNSRHEGKGSPWWTWGVAAAGMAAVAWLTRRQGRAPPTIGAAAACRRSSPMCSDIVHGRCAMCHAAEPVWAGLTAPPKGVLLDTDEHDPPARAARSPPGRVRSDAMPPGNITEITPDERLMLGRLVADGAPRSIVMTSSRRS